MKNIVLSVLMIVFISTMNAFAQGCGLAPGSIPQLETKNGITYWGGYPIDTVVKESELIFEGKILSDSVFMLLPIGEVCTYHRIQVLKKFKGQFISDTITAVNGGGRIIYKDRIGHSHWEGEVGSFAQKGDEAVFFVSTDEPKRYKINDAGLFFIIYGAGCGFVKVCDKKDVVKEVYEPIEAATGQPYVDVHPNNCKGQQSQQK